MSNLYNNGIMKKIGIYLSFAVLSLSVGCGDWSQMEPVDQQSVRPSEQNPELWAQYTAALRAYKAGSHTLVVAASKTAPKSHEREGLPAQPSRLAGCRFADQCRQLFGLRRRGPCRAEGEGHARALLRGLRGAERRVADLAALADYLDRVVARVRELGLDGFSFRDSPTYGDETAQSGPTGRGGPLYGKIRCGGRSDKPLALFSRATRSS